MGICQLTELSFPFIGSLCLREQPSTSSSQRYALTPTTTGMVFGLYAGKLWGSPPGEIMADSLLKIPCPPIPSPCKRVFKIHLFSTVMIHRQKGTEILLRHWKERGTGKRFYLQNIKEVDLLRQAPNTASKTGLPLSRPPPLFPLSASHV